MPGQCLSTPQKQVNVTKQVNEITVLVKREKKNHFFLITHECSMSFYVMLYIYFYLEDIL